MADKLFYFLSFVTLLSALMVVFSKNPVHSVLYLILCFFSLSGHYILLNAQFLAAVNIIVYAGAIMVLFLFVIMFLNLRADIEPQKSNLLKVAAAILGGLLLLVLVASFRTAELQAPDLATYSSKTGLVETLGMALFENYLLPFELVSVLFLVALVGAVMLGKREEGQANRF